MSFDPVGHHRPTELRHLRVMRKESFHFRAGSGHFAATMSRPFQQCGQYALSFVVLLAFCSCAPAFHRKVSAQVLASSGKVSGKLAGRHLPLAKGQWIEEGTTITCGSEGRADLMLLPGILVELGPDSEMTVQRLRLSRDGDQTIHPMVARAAIIRLAGGTLFGSVGQAQTRSRLIVETDAGRISADPQRAFKLIVRRDKIWLLSARGNVDFTAAGGEENVIVSPAQFADLPGDRSAQPAAAARHEIQAQVPEILGVQRRLVALASDSALSFLPWENRPKKN